MLLVFAMLCFSSIAISAQTEVAETENYAPFRYCLWSNLGWPNKNVYGWNFGWFASGQEAGKSIVGLDSGLLYSDANNVSGLQTALLCITKKSNVSQISVVNVCEESKGFQFGVVNVSTKSKGFQF
ncbi:MAG TPA: hypothetical protein QF753_07375 [Victivallales bacterium]|nr:hypothetical protein [Victivallales bacterium]